MSVVPPPMSITMLPHGVGHRQAGADRRRHAFFDQVHLARLGAIGAVDDRAALDLRNPRGNADDDARPAPGDVPWAFLMKLVSIRSAASKSAMTPSRIGRIVVIDGGRAPEHRVRLVADRLGLVARGVDGHDGRLVENDAAPGGKDDRVCRAEVDREVAGTESQDVQQHNEAFRSSPPLARPVPLARQQYRHSTESRNYG